MQEKKEKMTLMQSLCAFSYPRAYNSLLLLISTLDLRSKVLPLTIVFLLRTSAIQTSLIALGLLSIRIFSNKFDQTVLETHTRHKK